MRQDRLAVPTGFVDYFISGKITVHSLLLIVVEHKGDLVHARVVGLRSGIFTFLSHRSANVRVKVQIKKKNVIFVQITWYGKTKRNREGRGIARTCIP